MPEMSFRMSRAEARAVWHSLSVAVTLLREIDDVPPSAPLYGQENVLLAVARRLDHEINHAAATPGEGE
jgi:hypothetical protein